MKPIARIACEEQDEKKEKKEGEEPFAEKFLKTRQILLSGEVSEELAEKIVRQLLIMEADSDKPIYIYIDSPGGDVDAGFAIFDTIRFINAPVYTVGMGLIASAAALILLAAPKERRLGLPHSHYLIHQPSSGMKGVATDIEIHAAELAKTRAMLNYTIDPEKCKGCSACSRVCPADAISGVVRSPFKIDQSKCIKCGSCMEKCKFGAISKG